MIRQYELVEAVRAYNPHTDEALLNKAYVFAMRAHGTQKRASGDPYFTHPIAVALILTKLRPDDACLAAALLHDVLEDTDHTREDLCIAFGEDVATMVDGVTKLTRLEGRAAPESQQQAENFRKLLLAGADDIRVLLIKLADRLHNMRTLHFFGKPEKRVRIARETLDLFAPLAGRIGLIGMAEELEELSFAETDPELRTQIVAHIETLRSQTEDHNGATQTLLENTLRARGVTADVTGRVKTPYSVFRKMQQKNIDLKAVPDIIGFRVIVNDVEDCYRALATVHGLYPCVPGRFKDYISTPKRNGYRSLHTGVICGDQRIEVQIRTRDMHAAAERGPAAHRKYKDGADDPARYAWIRELLEDAASGTAVDLLEHVKLEIFHDQVFCFTPNGRLIRLPRGASTLDFAYAVHTDLGNTCAGAKINGIRVPLRTPVQNGDTVEIISDPQQTPSPAWESLAITGRAKAAIRRFSARRTREQYIKLGRSLIESTLRAGGLPYDLTALHMLAHRLRYPGPDDMCAQAGRGTLHPDSVLSAVEGGIGHAPVLGLCSRCRPLPGDEAVIVHMPFPLLHRVGCSDGAGGIPARVPAGDAQTPAPLSTLRIEIANRPGALGAVACGIGQHAGNIINCAVARIDTDFQVFMLDVQVRDRSHVETLLAALTALPEVAGVERVFAGREGSADLELAEGYGDKI